MKKCSPCFYLKGYVCRAAAHHQLHKYSSAIDDYLEAYFYSQEAQYACQAIIIAIDNGKILLQTLSQNEGNSCNFSTFNTLFCLED